MMQDIGWKRRFFIDFMRYRPVFLVISFILMVTSAFLLATRGLRRSIDFTGGLLLELHFAEPIEVDRIRTALTRVDLGESTIQQYGSPQDILIRISQEQIEALARAKGITGVLSVEVMMERLLPEITRSIYATLGVDVPSAERPDLNNTDRSGLVRFLTERDPLGLGDRSEDARRRYEDLADRIYRTRLERFGGVAPSWEALFDQVSLPPAVQSALREHFVLGPFTILAVESVGPQIGRELIRKTITAVVVALLVMLIYIWFRFDLVFGVMALMCLVHDVLILLGALSWTGREISLPVVAALLTVVGYDVNDTIVIYDRIRENKNARRFANILDLYNVSLNQTLSRTLLTSLTTLFILTVLYFFGGVVLNDFAFVMIVGVILGTYSSIYIASSLAAYWYEWRYRRVARVAVASRASRTKVSSASR